MRWAVRRATVADAPELGWINVAAWRSAYRGLVPDQALDSMDVAAQVPRWQSWLARPEPDAVWVFADNPAAQRFYRARGWRRDPDALLHWSVGDRDLPEWRFSRQLAPGG